VRYFFIGKQKVVLFPKHRENGWEFAASALITLPLLLRIFFIIVLVLTKIIKKSGRLSELNC
jgi:hypothetical protein